MSVEKATENWTKFPNFLLDNLESISGNELKILSLIIRKTIGYSNPNRKFSISYMQDKLDLSKNTVLSSISSLIEKDLIKQFGVASDGSKLYNIIWKEPKFQIDRSRKITKRGSKNELPASSKNEQGGVQKMNRGGSKNELPASSKNEPSIRTNTNKLLEKKEEKEKTDFSCYDLLSGYYEYLQEKGFTLSENFVDRSYVNNFQNDSAYSNLQIAKNKSKYLLMFEDAIDLLDKILFIEETAKKHPQVKQDAIYLNLPKTYYLGSVLKSRLSILNVFGKCQEIRLKPTTFGLGFYDGVNTYKEEENPHHVDFNGFHTEEKNVATLVKEDSEHDDIF